MFGRWNSKRRAKTLKLGLCCAPCVQPQIMRRRPPRRRNMFRRLFSAAKLPDAKASVQCSEVRKSRTTSRIESMFCGMFIHPNSPSNHAAADFGGAVRRTRACAARFACMAAATKSPGYGGQYAWTPPSFLTGGKKYTMATLAPQAPAQVLDGMSSEAAVHMEAG